MNSINIVVFLVRCSADLLACETLPSEHLHFAAMETCRAEVAQMTAKKTGSDGGVYMGKCIYLMAEADPRRERRNRIYANSGVVQLADAAY